MGAHSFKTQSSPMSRSHRSIEAAVVSTKYLEFLYEEEGSDLPPRDSITIKISLAVYTPLFLTKRIVVRTYQLLVSELVIVHDKSTPVVGYGDWAVTVEVNSL